jgi:hypothetical protein
MGSGGRRNSGQPLLRYGESVSMMSVCTGAAACFAITPMLALSALSGARMLRVPSGNSNSTLPRRRSATAARIICMGGSLQTYRARRAPEPRNTFFKTSLFITHTTFGWRVRIRSASIMQGWLGARMQAGWPRSASIARKSSRYARTSVSQPV